MGPAGDRASARTDLRIRIAEWQSHVLQLDRRNGLLYFKPTGRSSVRVLTQDVDNLFKTLEDAGKGLSFDHVQPRGRQNERILFVPGGKATDGNEPDYVVIEGDLDTEGDPRDLQKRLFSLQKRDREWLEEQGINVLFLAIGTLQWIDDEGRDGTIAYFEDSIGGESERREFLSLPGVKDARPRGKDLSGGRTRILEISFVELGAGVEAIVSGSFGITSDDAIVAASRAFGFARTGEDIRGRISTTIDRLLRSGRLSEKDGKLFSGSL